MGTDKDPEETSGQQVGGAANESSKQRVDTKSDQQLKVKEFSVVRLLVSIGRSLASLFSQLAKRLLWSYFVTTHDHRRLRPDKPRPKEDDQQLDSQARWSGESELTTNW